MISRNILLISLVSLAPACSGSQPKALTPAAQAPVEQGFAPVARNSATTGTIVISDDVRKACGLSEAEAYFAFDSDHVRPQDKRILHALADCFVSGPLKDRQMSLIGHADPRGARDYNLALAGRRADNVKTLIVAESMNGNRVSTTSRGAMDATGTNEATWANDRSVDVTLGI